jgi:predicted enzyme related to lactoylglutathione lyase
MSIERGGTTNPVVHFEMPYDDHKRLAKFSAPAFGWKMEKLGQEMGDYGLASAISVRGYRR